jgi:hypothetical protein
MNSACIVCRAGGLEGLRPSKKNPRMHALLQEIIVTAGVIPIDDLRCSGKLAVGDVPNPMRPISNHHPFSSVPSTTPHDLTPDLRAEGRGILQTGRVTGLLQHNPHLLRALAVWAADRLSLQPAWRTWV